MSLRGPTPTGLARSIAVVAAAPAVEGLVLVPDALVDLETPLWDRRRPSPRCCWGQRHRRRRAARPGDPVTVLSATPITATEAAWVRLKGADAMREAWRTDGVDVLDHGGAPPPS